MKKFFLVLILGVKFSINCFSQTAEEIRDSSKFVDYSIIDDSLSLKKINERNEIKFTDKVNFDKEFLIYNTIWVDCSGTFYINKSYDSLNNTLTCNLYIKYGGSRGMCIKDNFLKIKKTKPGLKIIFKEYRLR